MRCHVCAVTCFPPVSCLESNFCVDSCLIMAQVIMYRLQALKHFEKGHKINSEELNQSIIHKNENIISYNNYSATFISFLSRPVNSWYGRFALKQVSHNLTKRCTRSYVWLGCSSILGSINGWSWNGFSCSWHLYWLSLFLYSCNGFSWSWNLYWLSLFRYSWWYSPQCREITKGLSVRSRTTYCNFCTDTSTREMLNLRVDTIIHIFEKSISQAAWEGCMRRWVIVRTEKLRICV